MKRKACFKILTNLLPKFRYDSSLHSKTLQRNLSTSKNYLSNEVDDTSSKKEVKNVDVYKDKRKIIRNEDELPTSEAYKLQQIQKYHGRLGRPELTQTVKKEFPLDVYYNIEESRVADPERLEEFKMTYATGDPMHHIRRGLRREGRVMKIKAKELMGVKGPTYNDNFTAETEVLIIGGGAIGSSVAYWIKDAIPEFLAVTVVEKDLTFAESSTALSAGGLRQQFSLKENIEMSLFGADFIRTMGRRLRVRDLPPPDAGFQPYGYLLLATSQGAEQLQRNAALQISLGAKNELLSPERLKAKFPWLNVDGIALGCLGLEKEGWFDPWSLLNAFKYKATTLGADYLKAEVIGFEFTKRDPMPGRGISGPSAVVVQLADTKEIKLIKFTKCVIAAGADSGRIAQLANIGMGDGIMACPLPVERRKRYVYCFSCPDGPGLNTPLVIDHNGTYFRREGLGGHYIGGLSPRIEDEPDTTNLDVDYDFYEETVWPNLAKRVPCFENSKLNRGWAGFYEYNYLDQNGVIGTHPIFNNIIFATGFSGHGIQHSPAIGRAVMELVLHGRFQTIDLDRFRFERFGPDMPLLESGIY